MARIICLGGGVESLPIIQRVKEMGHRAIVVDGDLNAPGHELTDGDTAVFESCYHADRLIPALKRFPDSVKFDAVLPAATDTPHVAAAIRAEFGLPGMGVAEAGLSVDKYEQKRVLWDNGMSVPKFARDDEFFVVNTGDVIKPIDSRGGRGVIRLLPNVDREWAYAEAKRHSPTGRVMVEQWLDGPQLSTESIVQNGRVMFTAIGLRNYSRLWEFAPYVIEDGFDSPYTKDDKLVVAIIIPPFADRIDSLIQRACKALNWYQTGGGTVKGDLVIHNGELHIIELAARLSGGFFATHGHWLAYQVPFVDLAINMALGDRVINVDSSHFGSYVCQRYVFPKPADIGKTVESIHPLSLSYRPYAELVTDHLASSPFRTYAIKKGDTIRPVTCHADRWGQAIATGRTPDEARQRAERAVEEMREGVVLR